MAIGNGEELMLACNSHSLSRTSLTQSQGKSCNPAALVLHSPYSTLLAVTGFQWQVRDSLSFSGTERCPEGFFYCIRDSLQTEVKNSSSEAKIPWENKWNLYLPASVFKKNQNALHSQNTQRIFSLHINLPLLLRVITQNLA